MVFQHPPSIRFRRSWIDSWLKDELEKSVEVRGKFLVKMSAGLRLVEVYCGTSVPASTCSSIYLYLRSMCLVRVLLCDMCCSVSAMAARLPSIIVFLLWG